MSLSSKPCGNAPIIQVYFFYFLVFPHIIFPDTMYRKYPDSECLFFGANWHIIIFLRIFSVLLFFPPLFWWFFFFFWISISSISCHGPCGNAPIVCNPNMEFPPLFCCVWIIEISFLTLFSFFFPSCMCLYTQTQTYV